ncbi:MAG: hypothetical protein ABIQ06_13615 [Caldimonas sp.]
MLAFAEPGLVGYFAWLGLIVVTWLGLGQALRAARPDAKAAKLALALRAALVAYLTCAWFLSRTYSPGLFVLLALCVARWSVSRTRERWPIRTNRRRGGLRPW